MEQADYTRYTDEELLQIYQVYRQNLVDSELKAAGFGHLNVPVPLQNEIRDFQRQIKLIKAELDRRSHSSSSPGLTPLIQITILIQCSLEAFNDLKRQLLIQQASTLTSVPQDQIKILRVESGSVRVLLEMPKEAAQKLVDLFQSGALRHLHGIGDVRDIYLNDVRKESHEEDQQSHEQDRAVVADRDRPLSLRNLFSSNNPLVVALGVLASIATIIALVFVWPKSSNPTTYRGRVLNEQTGAGIANAKVTLFVGSENARIASTDGEGNYSFVFELSDDTAEGKIRVERAGFNIY
jgi:hypothetical protein